MPLVITTSCLQMVERRAKAFRADRILAVLPKSELSPDIACFAEPNTGLPTEWVECSDLESDRPWDAESLAYTVAKGLVLPDDSHVGAIIAYAKKALAEAGEARILVHCHGGMSRSPAAALIMLAVEDGPGFERRSVDRLAEIDDGCLPNDRMLRIADRLLDRGGRLHSACTERFRARKTVIPDDLADMFVAGSRAAAP